MRERNLSLLQMFQALAREHQPECAFENFEGNFEEAKSRATCRLSSIFAEAWRGNLR
jgi:hypothetical protein